VANAALSAVTWRTTDAVDAALAGLTPVALDALEPGASLVLLPHFSDERGTLVPVDTDTVLPFEVHRAWAISGAPLDGTRGRHAHYECEQAFWCSQGAARFVVTDGTRVAETTLHGPDGLILIPAGLWVQIDRCEPGTVLFAFASHPYDENDYRSTITPDR